jgi:Tfp pilus assembly protein PilV
VSTKRPRATGGFTIIEVLIAFVILAIGLLALEGLGIGAARMVTRAQRLSDYNNFATSKLEETLSLIRQGTTPSSSSGSFSGGTWVVTPGSSAMGTATLRTVTVSIRPTAGRVLAASDSFSVTGYVLN